jgi:RHS repeat-associated protein
MPMSLHSFPLTRALARLFSVVLLAGAAGGALACPTTPGQTCAPAAPAPASQPLGVAVNLGAGNPINVINGNKYQREEDMPALPGVMGLEIVRHYNSAISGPEDWTGRIGRGWRLSYETRLIATQHTIEVLQADGARLMFSRDVLRPALATPDDPVHGVITVKHGGRGDEYVWRWADGRELSFNYQGQLMQIQAASGEITSLMYDPKGPLVRVTDPQGRSLTLTYLDRQSAASGDRFRGVQSIQSPVGRFSYEYGSAAPPGMRGSRRNLIANLVRVHYPVEGQGRQYHYEDASHPTFMTGISIEGAGADGKSSTQRYATFGYDAKGKGVLSSHANGVDKVTLDFAREGVTVLTNSLGQTTTYRYAGSDGAYRLVEVRGAGCALCGTPNQRYRYDKLGRLVETMQLNPEGIPTESNLNEFDGIGRLARVSHVVYRNGKAGPPQMQVRYEFSGSAAAPYLIARPSVVPGREWITEIYYGGARGTLPMRITESGAVPTYDGKSSAGVVTRTIAYRYNSRGQRTETDGPQENAVKDAGPSNSDISRVQYEPRSHLPSRSVEPGNVVTAVLERDAALRPVRLRSSDGHRAQTTSTSYNWRSQPTDIVTEAVLLDQAGAEVAGSKIARTLRYTYDAAGRLVSVTAPGNLTTRLAYDAAGRLVEKTLPDGSRVTMAQDTEGKLLTQGRYADAGPGAAPLSINRFKYDSTGRLEQTEDSVGLLSTVRYTSAGQVARLTNALGTATRFDYDDNGLLQARIDGDGSVDAAPVHLERDAHGQLTLLKDANGVATTRRYDDFGRKVAELNPDRGMVLFRHDAAGHVTARIDDSGSVTRYSYDPAGRLATLGADAQPDLMRYRYEGRHLVEVVSTADGNPAHATERTRYQRDGLGQVTQEHRWVARVDAVAVGALRRVSATSTPLRGLAFVTDSRYDDAGRLIWQRLPDGHAMEYRYAAETSGATRAGQLLTVLFDQRPVVADIAQTLAGGLTGYTMGNGVRQSVHSDGRGRVTELLAQTQPARPGEGALARWWRQLNESFGPAATPLLVYGQSNHYDQADRVERIERQQAGAANARRVEHFSYDRLDRLTGVDDGGTHAITWRYDRGGNRVEEKGEVGELNYHYQPGSNRLVAMTSSSQQLQRAAWLYHPSGVPLAQLTTTGARSTMVSAAVSRSAAPANRRIVYNNGRRPVAVYGDQDNLVARYAYNGLGERIAKTVYPVAGAQGRTSYSLYREQRLVAETDGDGRITAHYVYLDGKPVAKIEMRHSVSTGRRALVALRTLGGLLPISADAPQSEIAGIYAIHTDHLGTPQAVTDENAQLIWQATTTPFGLATVSYAALRDGRSFEMNLRLPGQVYDAETGLNQNYYRDYDPQLGRYTSADPLGLAGGANPYTYVDSNPLTKIDPLGLYEQDVHYYVTYFLARAAGVDARMAYLIATGTQYIDDNPITQPMKEGLLPSLWQIIAENAAAQNRLARYHFTQKPTDDAGTEMTSRYKNPSNGQLDLLAAAAFRAETLGSECAKAVMYGEYLHAFEDTFAHRRYDNVPIGINAGFGHATSLHFPDHTYNETRILGHDWLQNEDRTLEMQREVYALLKGTWNGKNERESHSFSDIEDLLKNFNKTVENSQNTNNFDSSVADHREKVSMLNTRLNSWGYDFVAENGASTELDLRKAGQGQYSAGVGASNRNNYYKYSSNVNGNQAGDAFNVDDTSFDGVILK